MERCEHAIHLRTGDGVVDAAVGDWLERNHTQTVSFSDVFETCVYALSKGTREPSLALIGTDWIAPDELGIIRYLREAWPRVTAVLYGRLPADVMASEFGVRHFGSASAIRDMLKRTPAALTELKRGESDEGAAAGVHRTLEPLLSTPSHETSRGEKREPPVPNVRTKDAAVLAAELAARPPEALGKAERGTADSLHRAILTQEELKALLEDEET